MLARCCQPRQLCSDTATEAPVEPAAAVTVRFCAVGRVALAVALKVIPDGLRVDGSGLGPPVTTKTTGYVSGLLGYSAVTVTVPRYAPVARPAWLAVSVMVFPIDVAVSHAVEVVTETAGVDCPMPGNPSLVSLKATFCDAGLAPPLL